MSIKQLDELIKQRNIMKENHRQKRMLQADVQSEILEKVQVTRQAESDLEKAIEPFKTLENSKEIDITDPVQKTILDDYGLLEANIDKKLPKSMLFEHSTSIVGGRGQTRFYLGGKEIFVNPKESLLFAPDKTAFIVDRNFVDLLRGADLEQYENDDLLKYRTILDKVGTAKNAKRYKDLKYLLTETFSTPMKSGKGITFLPDDPKELINRLEILLAATKEGHNSSFNEIHAILKRLLEKGIISEKDYKTLARS